MACPLQLANYLCILLVLGKKHLQLTDDPPLKLIPAFVQSQPSLYVWISVPIPKDIWRIPYISGCVRNVFRIRKWLNSWTSSCMKWPLPFQSWWSNSRYFRYFTFVKSCLIFVQDFSTDNAFKYLERYKKKYPVFNDDIQGTGAVVLSGFLNAAKLSSLASGQPLSSHRILFFGAGSAGVGVAQQLMSFFTLQGLSKEEAHRCIWLVDSQGLVYNTRGQIAEHKKCKSTLTSRSHCLIGYDRLLEGRLQWPSDDQPSRDH